MAYLPQHVGNVLQEAAINLNALTKGMIVRMRYKKLDGKSKEYWILVLQPKWKGQTDKNYLIHALNLDVLPTSDLFRLAEETGIIGSKSLWADRRLDIEKLQLDMSSRRFYNSNLKNVKILGSAYRTYLFNNVVSVRVCDYNFGTSFEDIVDLGIED
tara:strand:+ start:120 stop:590 length:471 start_codon:yes stop_codon:yes gene_type:complete